MSIQEIDSWVIDKIFQKICDWVWRKIPVSCFTLARLCIFLSCIFVISSEYSIFLLTLVGANFCINLVFIKFIESLTKRDTLNWYRYELWGLRTIFVLSQSVLLVLPPYSARLEIGILFDIGFGYFAACQPLPPYSRKSLKERFDVTSENLSKLVRV